MNPNEIVRQSSKYQMISIIVPVYNVQDYIINCLESIGSQSYQGDMECILVDDCGKDSSMVFAEQFISSYKGRVNFKIVHHDYNRGLSAARNTGMKIACGEFFTFVDSDDWIEPNMYEELYNKLVKEPRALFVMSSITAETPDGSLVDYADTAHYTEGGIITPYEFLKLVVSSKTCCCSVNRLYRRDYFQIPFHEGRICEDYLFLFDNSRKCLNTDYYFIMTKKAFYHYNIRMGSITSNEKQTANLWELDFMENMTYVADLLKIEYPELYDLQVKRFSGMYRSKFYEIVNNKHLVIERRETLRKLNKYVRIINKNSLSLMTKIDIFIATHFSNGYEIDRYIVKFRKNFKSIIKL